ncbi:DinB family protein [Wenyingzhuangia sp. 2_MG-2023]|uniref:DinB family protein n=1 Tax=Wenyingzhuangia sp. 2_MG-2023 TaxID=3062639 RepID=UPI0026E15BBF|nr:DinB family protein [Wenyingzhuangia sp. 2_MG-2023]MDO6736472.1 DinB family protein [Wenyingzhuangia sp. 2_MG-2023]
MAIEKQIDILKKGRALILRLIENFSLEQINQIPEGFNNNIGWNVGHLVVTQQLLCYKFSGLENGVSEEMISKYRKGTDPKEQVIEEREWDLIKKLFLELPNSTEEDYGKGVFVSYNEYETSVGVVLDSVEKAIDFNNFHEGIHLGAILALRKLV